MASDRVLGIFAGSGLLKSSCLGDLTKLTVETDFGEVIVHKGDGFYVIQRHGADPKISYSQPGLINYKANVCAFQKLGVTHCVMFCSVGSLRLDYPVGTLVLGDDIFNLWNQISLFDDYRSHITIEMNKEFREEIHEKLTAKANEAPLNEVKIVNGGTYVQTPGPRFETKAEIKVIKNYGDMVGMTAGHEVVLLCECKIKVAMIACVDNYANGLAHDLTLDEYRQGVATNLKRLEYVFTTVEYLFNPEKQQKKE